ncbi:hypothetical protein [Actinokineospora sp.]|uniref:hypothetical protein n=1 Tax=Actinokineospora sp. TaxID=1872133 RepID=UPI003D6AE0D2
MHEHADNPHHHEHDPEGVDDHRQGSRRDPGAAIPRPRVAPDDDITGIPNLPETGPDQRVWWYDQGRKRGGDRRYSGHINYIHGADADRVRGEFAAVVGDRLDWAARHQSESDADTDDLSCEDGDDR